MGNGKTVTGTGFALGGSDGANYVLGTVATTTANVTAITVTGSFTAANKPYDGNNTATILTRSITSGIVGSEDVTLTGGTATFDNKNVGNGKTVTGTGFALGGSDGANYVLGTVATTTANVTAITVTGSFTAANKPYDGNNTATILTRSITSGIVGSEDVTLTGGTATFDNKNVGNGKTVTGTGFALGGSDGANYVLGTVATTTANITAIALTATVAANNKPYDGNATATIDSCSFNGVISGETVNCVITGYSASFNNKNAGTDKPVSATGLSMTGTDGGNYSFNGTGTGTADIYALGFNGFLSPIGGADATGGDSAHAIRTVKLGSTLPVKFIAYGNGGTPWLTGIHTIRVIKYSSTITSEQVIEVSATDAATTGNQFRLTDGQWHFNMSTKSGFSQGTWKIVATLEDGTEHYAWIEFKK